MPLPLTYYGALCGYLLGWLCPAQVFPETVDGFKMKDSFKQSKKTFSGIFFFGMLKSALFKTTLDATSFLAYFEFLIKICTETN